MQQRRDKLALRHIRIPVALDVLFAISHAREHRIYWVV